MPGCQFVFLSLSVTVSFDCAHLCLTDTRLAISAVTTNNVFEKAIIQNHKNFFLCCGRIMFAAITFSSINPELRSSHNEP